MKLVVIIPAYNEEKTIAKTISNLRKENYKDIIVIDDGSKDKTYDIAKKENVLVYKHIINRGLGGALTTGIEAALREKADIIVTFDADLQHNPKDIKKLVEALKEGYDVAIGNRIAKGMPFTRRIGNRGLDIVTFLIFGTYISDTQSGLRAFTRKAAEKLDLKTNRMEISSEIIKEIGRNNLRVKNIPIEPIYTEYSMSKGQSWHNAFNIIYKLILRRVMK